MSTNELNAKAQELREINSLIEELTAQADAIKDAFKAAMIDRGVEVLNGDGWKASWKNVVSSRFDSKSFKADHSDLYNEYSKPTTTTRFLFA